MSFPNPNSAFMVQQPYSDAIGIWPQSNSDQQSDPHSQFDLQPPLKRPRGYEENPSNSSFYPSRMNPSMINPPINKGTTNIFFKTRICAKFKQGTCRNGENCNFAHGVEDLRQPPPNWQELVGGGGGGAGGGGSGCGSGGSGGGRFEEDRSLSCGGSWDDDQKIIHKMKLCKKYYNGEECPYGDRCNFLHEDPSKFREDTGRYRESSVISIGTTGPIPIPAAVPNQSEGNKNMNNALYTKPVFWKTKLCIKWTTGQCPFGEKCHFAHGEAGTYIHDFHRILYLCLTALLVTML